MVVSLYTSRVVLYQLGIEDYGIYNVVGGVVVMFSFLNSAMSSATQRYLAFELGRGNTEQLKRIFTTSIHIHILIAIIVLILSETVGLWLLYNKMTIPLDRMDVSFWVFQFSVVSTIVMFISVPYNATIIAHEKMAAFAYISIFEVLLKLLIVYLLLIIKIDKLFLYSLLMLGVQILIRIIYGIYCKLHFEEARYHFAWNGRLFKEMLNFSTWNLFGNMAQVAFTQGGNILLNIFFGPAVNAARGIAVQVQGTVSQFSSGFQTALNPQITKSYAVNDFRYMHSLIYRSSRFTFILLYCICLPVFMETDMMLELWLKEVPEYSSTFLRIILSITIIDSMANSLMVSAQATGRVKKYQSVVGGILLMILPISYVVLKFGGNPQSVFVVHWVICVMAFVVRLYVVKPLINLDIKEYFINVILRCFIVAFVAAIIPLVVSLFLDKSMLSSIIICLCAVVSASIVSFTIGLAKNEQSAIICRLKSKLNKKYL